ncbi:MAG: helix-turn-helix domain-containing protein [Deltaproteobacteria bacterium]|nr:helix-turn-helix domain-containing protein [Deltaproteobacteria bacterium]
MAGRTITMTELVETIYHWHQGHSISGIAKSLGMSRNTVKKYVKIGKRGGVRRDVALPDRGELAGILSGLGEYRRHQHDQYDQRGQGLDFPTKATGHR